MGLLGPGILRAGPRSSKTLNRPPQALLGSLCLSLTEILVSLSIPEPLASCLPPPASSEAQRVWGGLLPGTHMGTPRRGLTPPWSTNTCQTCGSKPVNWAAHLWPTFIKSHGLFLPAPFPGLWARAVGRPEPSLPFVAMTRDVAGA